MIQTLANESEIPVLPIQRSIDKLTRWMDVTPHIENNFEQQPDNRFVMVPVDAPWLQPFFDEVESLTADMTHDHDDQFDPLADAVSEAKIMMNYSPPAA